MLDFFMENMVLSVVFVALAAVIVLTVVIAIAYLVLRRAVRWGIDNSETAKAYRTLTEYQLREKYKEEE